MTTEVSEREHRAIEHDLSSPDEEMRRLAVERLLSLPTSVALPLLSSALADSSWRVRKAVVERLVALGDFESMQEPLIAALGDGENSGRRNSAFEALVGIGSPVLPGLIAALSSDDVDVRKLVVDVLAAIGDPDARQAVTGMLADPDPNVRGAAADALGVIGDSAAAEAMHRVATSSGEDQLVRLSALRALARIEYAPSVEALGPVLDDAILRPAAFALLGRVANEASLDCLLKGVALSSPASREAAMAALLRIVSESDGAALEKRLGRIRQAFESDAELAPWIAERLPESDLSTRMTLIQFLGIGADERSVLPLLEAGRDEAIAEVAHGTLSEMGSATITALEAAWPTLSVDLRIDACRLMGRLEGEAVSTLLLTSLDDCDGELRAAAAQTLGERHCMAALQTLVRRLEHACQDDDPDAEEEVDALIGALVALAPPDGQETASAAEEVIDLLSARLDGASEPVRLAIASVLGRIGRHCDEDLVTCLLKDPSARVRRAAVEALARLEPETAPEPLRLALADESSMVRVAAAAALGSSRSPAVIDDLKRLIHDEDTRVRSAAVRSIGGHCRRESISIERGVELIRHTLGGDAMVSLAAVEAMCMMGGVSAARAALEVLERPEPELVQTAVVCIGAHGDGEAVSELLSLVSHPSWSVRSEVIQTLAERRVGRAIPLILRRLEIEQDSFVRDAILRALKHLED